MTAAPALLVHDGTHGVAAYAREIAWAVDAQHPVSVIRFDDAPSLAPGSRVHVHFTDRLWADSPEAAARAFEELAGRYRVSVTLHDVPQASDGERNRPRRRACYTAVAASAVGVAVNSAHERALLHEEGVWAGPVAVLPLPVEIDPAGVRPPADASIGVLGYFYPGKGHDEALEAAREAGAHRLTVLGRASDGHADDLAAFIRRGEDAGIAVEVTGWLGDDKMRERARRVAVPVIAHRHVSASGSLTSWIGYGRRPVAVVNRYIAEMAALRPGTLEPVEPIALAGAVRHALAHPESTWHGLASVAAERADVAEAYLRWWAGG